jgi:hypothetical protein
MVDLVHKIQEFVKVIQRVLIITVDRNKCKKDSHHHQVYLIFLDSIVTVLLI